MSKKLAKNTFFIALALLAGVPAGAETLTLDTVVTLAQTGIGDEAVIAKIKSSGTHYDLSVEQMLDLKRKGVSGPIIAALMGPGTVQLSQDSPDPAVPHASGVYLLNESGTKVARIDPTVTNQAKTGGILGYAFTGGIASASIKASIQNASARVRSTQTTPQFYFFFDESNPQTANGPQVWAAGTAATVSSPSEFSLVRLNQKDGRREARVGSFNIAGGKTGVMDKDRIPFSYELVRPGVYRVKPSTALPKGEYGFMYSLTGGGGAGAMTARIFDFGIQ